jgi:hypothetical protein
MGFGFQLAKLILISALVFQGLYLLGFFGNNTISSDLEKGLDQYKKKLKLPAEAINLAKSQSKVIAKGLGAMILLVIFNLIANSKLVLKVVILGEFLLTLFVGVPWSLIAGDSTILNTSDKNLQHLLVNLAIIGGLLYWHSCCSKTTEARVPSEKEKAE